MQNKENIIKSLKVFEPYLTLINDHINLISNLIFSDSANQNTDEFDLFTSLLGKSFVTYLITSIWHFVDNSKQSYSFIQILEDIKSIGDYDIQGIYEDIKALKTVCLKVKDFRDKSVAHFDKNQRNKNIQIIDNRKVTEMTFNPPKDLYLHMYAIKEIFEKWYIIMTGDDIKTETYSLKKKVYCTISYES